MSKARRSMQSLIGLASMLALTWLAYAEPTWRESFEGSKTLWRPGTADAPYRVLNHELTQSSARSGRQSELIRFEAEPGAHVHFYLPLGRVELLDELKITVWLRANRPGMRLGCRVVLPREQDQRNLDQPLTVVLTGDGYEWTGRWQALHVADAVRRFQEQQQLLRAELGRDVNVDGAYIDQVLLNVYGGPGLHEVWIDDLEVSPHLQPSLPGGGAPGLTTSDGTPATPTAAQIELVKDRLQVNRKPFLLRGTRWAGRSPRELRDLGFNALWIDGQTPETVVAEAVRLGLLLVPELPEEMVNDTPAGGAVNARLTRFVREFPHQDSVLAWQLGARLTHEQGAETQRAAQLVRRSQTHPDRLIAGGVWDGLRGASRNIDLIGLHRWPLATGLELRAYRDWMRQRLNLAEPEVFTYTWVQTHWPASLRRMVSDGVDPKLAADLGPQPEQVKLLAYLALVSGCRGLAFWDEPLAIPGQATPTSSGSGTPPPLTAAYIAPRQTLAQALLNHELALLEPLLASRHGSELVGTRHPEIKMALMRFDGGLLVIPLWLGSGAQHVAGQMTLPQLDLVVPGTPRDAQAWLVSPVDVRTLAHERVPGGVRVAIPEFALTAAVIFTADINHVARLQQWVLQHQRQAAQRSYELAWDQIRQVEAVQQQLAEQGHAHPATLSLLGEARRHLAEAYIAWNRGNVSDFRTAYEEAQRAQRPLRLLMRSQWEQAITSVDAPTASPFTVSYVSLPRHYRFIHEVKACQVVPNVLAAGDFEADPNETLAGWTVQSTTLDAVVPHLARVAVQPRQGRQCLKLEVRPKDSANAPAALERTYLALTSPRFDLQPGMLVRVSGWIRIPQPIQASADGVLFFDSLGGEPLGLRLTGPMEWKQFSLYRRVPESGQISVTMALTGIGTAYFDDVRIEPLIPAAPTTAENEASQAPTARPAQVIID